MKTKILKIILFVLSVFGAFLAMKAAISSASMPCLRASASISPSAFCLLWTLVIAGLVQRNPTDEGEGPVCYTPRIDGKFSALFRQDIAGIEIVISK